MTISQAQREIKTISGEQEELQAGVEPFGESREMADINEEDLERKLEESLKNL